MRMVSKEVKKALNESFEFEPAEALNSIMNALNDERLKKIVGNIDCNDIQELVTEISKRAKNEIPEKAPLRISSIGALATWILVKYFKEEALEELNGMDKTALNDLVNCVCTEFLNTEMADNNDDMNDIEPKPQYNQEMNRNLPASRAQEDEMTECGNKKQVKECNEDEMNEDEMTECGNKKPAMKECDAPSTNECNCGGKKQVKECGNAANESLSMRRRRLYGRH